MYPKHTHSFKLKKIFTRPLIGGLLSLLIHVFLFLICIFLFKLPQKKNNADSPNANSVHVTVVKTKSREKIEAPAEKKNISKVVQAEPNKAKEKLIASSPLLKTKGVTEVLSGEKSKVEVTSSSSLASEKDETTEEARNNIPTSSFSANQALKKLLPKGETRARWQEEGEKYNLEGHISTSNGAEEAQEGAKLLKFAERFTEHLILPEPLRQYSRLAKAEAEIAKVHLLTSNSNSTEWKIWRLQGEPYFRALLYETLLAFLPTPAAQQSLGEFDKSRFIVALDYQKSNVLGPRSLQKETKLYGIKFSLQLKDFEIESAWAIPVANPQSGGGFDINLGVIGAFKNLVGAIHPQNPLEAKEMESLRRSPAFLSEGNVGNLQR